MCLGRLLISTWGILYIRKSSNVCVRISYTKRHGAQHLPIQKLSLIMSPWPFEHIEFQMVNHQGHYYYHDVMTYYSVKHCQTPHRHSLRRFSPLDDAISSHELEVRMLFVHGLDAHIVSHTCVPAWRNAYNNCICKNKKGLAFKECRNINRLPFCAAHFIGCAVIQVRSHTIPGLLTLPPRCVWYVLHLRFMCFFSIIYMYIYI